MSPQSPQKAPPALRHGAYSVTSVLPTESQADFDELHRSLVDEWHPTGPLECDIIKDIARWIWRKRNLGTIRAAQLAHNRATAIFQEAIAARLPEQADTVVHPASDEIVQVTDKTLRRELGNAYALIETGYPLTFAVLNESIEVEDRLGSMIDKSLKRLLLARGVKSVSGSRNPDS